MWRWQLICGGTCLPKSFRPCVDFVVVFLSSDPRILTSPYSLWTSGKFSPASLWVSLDLKRQDLQDMTHDDKLRLLLMYAATHPEKLDAARRLQWMKVSIIFSAVSFKVYSPWCLWCTCSTKLYLLVKELISQVPSCDHSCEQLVNVWFPSSGN